jgi:hypothetical protein
VINGAGAAAQASVLTSESTASQSYGDNLATVGPTVTVTIGNSGMALVHIFSAMGSNTTSSHNVYTSFIITQGGSTVQAASDSYAIKYQVYAANASNSLGATFLITGLTPGSTVFKMQYRVDGDTGSWANRRIAVVPQ